MKRSKRIFGIIRIMAGVLILGHGMLRILFLSKYIDFIVTNFIALLPSEGFLTIAAALFPFLEFFAGLLLLYKVSFKRALLLSGLISVVMSLFIIWAQMYPRLIYHGVVLFILLLLYYREKHKNLKIGLFDYPKSEIDARRNNFF